MSADHRELRVRGGATAEELAVVLAVLGAGEGDAPPPTPYARWRRTRLSALRRDPRPQRR